MSAAAYEKASNQYPVPTEGVPGSGCQQAASQSVIGYDANVTPTLVNQGIGLASVNAGLVEWDGSIP